MSKVRVKLIGASCAASLLVGCSAGPFERSVADPMNVIRQDTASASRAADQIFRINPAAGQEGSAAFAAHGLAVEKQIDTALQMLPQSTASAAVNAALKDYLSDLRLAVQEQQLAYLALCDERVAIAHHDQLSQAFSDAQGEEALEDTRLAANAASEVVAQKLNQAGNGTVNYVGALERIDKMLIAGIPPTLQGFELVPQQDVVAAINLAVRWQA